MKQLFKSLFIFAFFCSAFACSPVDDVIKEITVNNIEGENEAEAEAEVEVEAEADSLRIQKWFKYLCSPVLGGRYSGSEGIKNAVVYICNVIGHSDSLEVITFSTEFCDMNNIVFHLPGQNDSIIALGAHYDAYDYWNKTPLPGADDNMSGTAVMLNLIKKIQNKGFQPRYSIDICLFDGEELRRNGSNYYVNSTNKIKLYINADTCGDKDSGLRVYYDIKHPSLRYEFEEFTGMIKDITTEVVEYKPKGYTTDCECFERKDIPFVSIMNDRSTGLIHSFNDNVSHIAFDRIEQLSNALYDYLKTNY